MPHSLIPLKNELLSTHRSSYMAEKKLEIIYVAAGGVSVQSISLQGYTSVPSMLLINAIRKSYWYIHFMVALKKESRVLEEHFFLAVTVSCTC